MICQLVDVELFVCDPFIEYKILTIKTKAQFINRAGADREAVCKYRLPDAGASKS